jgi:hypothetical protein
MHIADLRPKGISIDSLDVSNDGSGHLTITIQGTALTRDDLVTFRNIIQGDKDFSGVDVPISDLASAIDIQFSMQMSYSLPAAP